MMKNSPFAFFKRLFDWIKQLFSVVRGYLLPQSLFYRFILIILLPLILLQTIMFIFFYDRHWEVVSRRLANDVLGEIETIADFISRSPSQHDLDRLLNDIHDNLSLEVAFFPKTHLSHHNVPEHTETKHLIPFITDLNYPVLLEKLNDKQFSISIQLPTGVLTTLIPRKRFFSSTVFVFLVWMIGSSLLLFGIAFLFMRNQVRSIEKLARAAELFGIGQDTPFKPTGATEVKRAGLSFLLMKNRIIRHLSDRTAMLAAVSHDLRTPLTRMKLQLSMMGNDETISDLLSDVEEMQNMLNAYLAFTRGEGKEESVPLKIDELITQLVEKQKKSGQNVSLHIEENITIIARPTDISRAITNILTNAHRYAKHTTVSLGMRNNMAQITIDDNGPGIPLNKRKDVFRAFYRIEQSRNKSTGGIGLGMTIARDIILSHGGDIRLDESPMNGLRVLIFLPTNIAKKSSPLE